MLLLLLLLLLHTTLRGYGSGFMVNHPDWLHHKVLKNSVITIFCITAKGFPRLCGTSWGAPSRSLLSETRKVSSPYSHKFFLYSHSDGHEESFPLWAQSNNGDTTKAAGAVSKHCYHKMPGERRRRQCPGTHYGTWTTSTILMLNPTSVHQSTTDRHELAKINSALATLKLFMQ